MEIASDAGRGGHFYLSSQRPPGHKIGIFHGQNLSLSLGLIFSYPKVTEISQISAGFIRKPHGTVIVTDLHDTLWTAPVHRFVTTARRHKNIYQFSKDTKKK
jgi:hypothetical protein